MTRRSTTVHHFFCSFGWSSRHLQANEYGISDHLKGCNHHHLTKNHPLYKDQLLISNVYISFSSMISTTSCPWSAINTLADSEMIELTPSSKWMWSYRLLNRAKLDPNKICAPPLPTSSGLQWRWRCNCSDKTLKVGNSVIDDCDIHFVKPVICFCLFILEVFLVRSYQMLVTFLLRSKCQK